MPLIIADRVRETSTTTGTGNLTLAGAQPGAQRFGSRMAVGDTTWYAITGPGGSWETGVGTYVANNTLERTTPLESSNGDARVNFEAGTKDVFVTVPAKRTADPATLQPSLERKPMPTFTAAGGETQAIFSIPAGSRSVSFAGSFAGSDPVNTQLRARLSFDGGSTYLSANDSYQWQLFVATGTSVTTSEVTANSMPFAAASDGGTALMTQFAVDLDFFPNRHPRFAGRATGAVNSANRRNDTNGFARFNGVPTHILIIQQGGTFVAGTQIRAEAR